MEVDDAGRDPGLSAGSLRKHIVEDVRSHCLTRNGHPGVPPPDNGEKQCQLPRPQGRCLSLYQAAWSSRCGSGTSGWLAAALALERMFRAAFASAWSVCPQPPHSGTLMAMGGWPWRQVRKPGTAGSCCVDRQQQHQPLPAVPCTRQRCESGGKPTRPSWPVAACETVSGGGCP